VTELMVVPIIVGEAPPRPELKSGSAIMHSNVIKIRGLFLLSVLLGSPSLYGQVSRPSADSPREDASGGASEPEAAVPFGPLKRPTFDLGM
jgi:hypothetical protein